MYQTVRIDVFGTQFLERRLHEIGERAADIEPALRSVADDMRQILDKGFDSRGLAHGMAWRPLASSTRIRKARDLDAKVKGNSQKMLVATGRMRRSLTVKTDPEHVEHVDRNTLILSSLVPYAAYHQHGTSEMPARPPVRLREHQRKRVVRKVERYIKTGIVT